MTNDKSLKIVKILSFTCLLLIFMADFLSLKAMTDRFDKLGKPLEWVRIFWIIFELLGYSSSFELLWDFSSLFELFKLFDPRPLLSVFGIFAIFELFWEIRSLFEHCQTFRLSAYGLFRALHLNYSKFPLIVSPQTLGICISFCVSESVNKNVSIPF